MTFLMHWSFKTGYHEIAAKKFLATGAPFPECKSWKRWHAPGSVEGWILVEADNADACYEHAAGGPSASTGRSPQCCQMSKQAPSLLRPTADRLMGAVPLNNPGGSTIRLNHSKTFSLEWLRRRRPLMDSNHRPTA